MTARGMFSRYSDKAFLGTALAALLMYGLTTGLAARQDDSVQTCAGRILEEARKEHPHLQAPPFPQNAKRAGEVNPLHESEILRTWERLPSVPSMAASADWTPSLLPRGTEANRSSGFLIRRTTRAPKTTSAPPTAERRPTRASEWISCREAGSPLVYQLRFRLPLG